MGQHNQKNRQSLYIFILIFIIFATSIISSGYIYYSHYKTQYKTEVGKQLTAIGKLKADELIDWWRGCFSDARALYKNTVFSALVRKYFNNPDNTDVRKQLETWLIQLKAPYKYNKLVLLDAKGIERISVPDTSKADIPHSIKETAKTISSGDVTFLDFHRYLPDNQIYLGMLVPILNEENNKQPIGVLVLRIDPNEYLYPYIANWPLPSVTAETLLVRKNGESIEYLNELKHKKNTALKLKYSLANKELPSVKAILGHEGIVDGIDYRGASVIADVRAVPELPWFIVTQMDTSEVYTSIKQRLWAVIVFITVLLSGTGIGLGLFWRYLRIRYYKEQYESAEKWCNIFDSLPDWISIIGRDFKFRLVNKTFADVFGKQPGELIGKRCCKLVHNTKEPPENCPMKKMLSTGKAAKTEIYYDALRKHLEISVFPIFDDNGEIIEAVHYVRDITKQKLMEEARRKTDTLLQNAVKFNSDIISNAGVGVIVYDTELRHIEWNTFMENLTGMEKKAVIGKKTPEVLPHLQEQGIDKLLQRALAGETVSSPDIIHQCPKTGKSVWIVGTYTPHRNSIGQVTGVIGIIRDISERKQVEDSLKYSEVRLRELFEHMSNAVAVYEPENNGDNFIFNDCNQALLNIEKVNKEQVIGKRITEVFPGVQEFGLFEVLQRVNHTGNAENFPIGLYKDHRISGWKENYVYKLPSGEIVAIYDDITDSKQAEEALRESERRFQQIAENAQEWIWETDANGLYTYASPIIENLLGYKPEELVGQKYFYDLFVPEEREQLKKAAFEVFARREPFKAFENRTVHKNGSIVCFITSGVPMLDDTGNLVGYRGADSDITERKQAEDALKKSKDELEQVNAQLMQSTTSANHMAKQAIEAYEAKRQFLANISHEIRTPMNAIIGFSDILAVEEMPEHQKEYVELIRQSGGNLLNMINDILDFSKADVGKLDLKKTVFFLSKIINSVESLMRPEAKKKGLKFEIIKCGNLPAQMKGDPARLRQCLVNLVNNAIKFTEQGYVRVKISQEQNDSKSFIRFDIEDSGIGIPVDQNEKIFESFVQVDGTASRKYSGAGLGLSITKQLTKLLGGQLTVTSESGKGSVFSLVVPTNIGIDSQTHFEVTDSREQEYQDVTITEPVKFSGRALVAEDVPTNQKLMSYLLEKMGLEVTMTDDGNKAVEKATGQSFDIIFMDIQMPNMNGYEATQAIRKKGIKTPIIALTAHAMPGDKQKCFEAGCDSYLSKPLIYSRLIQTIAKYLDGEVFYESADLTDKPGDPMDNENYDNEVENRDEVMIDWAKVTAGGLDEQIIKEVMPTYLDDSKKHLQELTTAVNTSDIKNVKLHAHAIKGTGRNMGVAKLSEVAGQLETMATQGDLSKAQKLLKSIVTEFEKFEKFVSKPDWIEIAKSKTASKTKA